MFQSLLVDDGDGDDGNDDDTNLWDLYSMMGSPVRYLEVMALLMNAAHSSLYVMSQTTNSLVITMKLLIFLSIIMIDDNIPSHTVNNYIYSVLCVLTLHHEACCVSSFVLCPETAENAENTMNGIFHRKYCRNLMQQWNAPQSMLLNEEVSNDDVDQNRR